MSNTISNKLVLSGNKELICQCLNKIKPEKRPFEYCPIDLDKIMPLKDKDIPEEVWGCRGNAFSPEIEAASVPTTENSIGFYTAIMPPIPVITELSKQYPELEFTLKYCDEWEGGEVSGIATFKNGLIKDTSCKELFGTNNIMKGKFIIELFPLTVDYNSIIEGEENG